MQGEGGGAVTHVPRKAAPECCGAGRPSRLSVARRGHRGSRQTRPRHGSRPSSLVKGVDHVLCSQISTAAEGGPLPWQQRHEDSSIIPKPLAQLRFEGVEWQGAASGSCPRRSDTSRQTIRHVCLFATQPPLSSSQAPNCDRPCARANRPFADTDSSIASRRGAAGRSLR